MSPMSPPEFDAIVAAAEAEFVRRWPRRSTETHTAAVEIGRIALRMKRAGWRQVGA